jgi:hypothetical protein
VPEPASPEGLVGIFQAAGLRHALIGGHAVNTWITPRETDDYDFVVAPDRAAIEAVEAALVAVGILHLRRQDGGEPSGPDFSHMSNPTRSFKIDFQVAKTDYQMLILERARPTGASGFSVATPEDLIVLKLLAMRSQDQRDIALMVDLLGPRLDWPYIEHWAATWDVVPALRVFRADPALA